jgi:hypothetical protein
LVVSLLSVLVWGARAARDWPDWPVAVLALVWAVAAVVKLRDLVRWVRSRNA